VGGASGKTRTDEKRARNVVGKPERKRSVGIPRRTWDSNIKMDLE
jgi:hypothetical protein